ncbi:hypothetical protein [Leeia aquatica]|nr:hypothetical protein [Leeia aquatica]
MAERRCFGWLRLGVYFILIDVQVLLMEAVYWSDLGMLCILPST